MSHLRNVQALALAALLATSLAASGTQPAAAARGLAGSPSLQMRPVSSGLDLQAPKSPAATTRTNLTEAQEQLVDNGIELLEAAGLRLPGIDIVGYGGVDGCFGRRGAAINHGLHTEVRLCLDGDGPADDWTVIHELAHAWEHHSITDETREAFLEVRGLDAWRDGEWHERGAEHAAEILVWGVIDREVTPVRVRPFGCEDLLVGYVTLTGEAPSNGYAGRCG